MMSIPDAPYIRQAERDGYPCEEPRTPCSWFDSFLGIYEGDDDDE